MFFCLNILLLQKHVSSKTCHFLNEFDCTTELFAQNQVHSQPNDSHETMNDNAHGCIRCCSTSYHARL